MTISLRFVLTFLVVLLIAHSFAYFFGWYAYWYIDTILHFIGGVWAACAFFALFSHFESVHEYSHPSEKVKMIIIAVGFTALLSIAWELHLFILSEYLGLYIQRSVGEVIYGMLTTLAGGAILSGTVILLKNSGQTKQIT